MDLEKASRGVVYIVFGERFVREAIHSAQSVKRHSNLPVTLFTDTLCEANCFDRVERLEIKNRRPKVEYLARSPYQDTLYLDSDTQLNMQIDDLFDLLDRFDIAAVQDHSRKSRRWCDTIPEYAEIPYSFPEYNGGVLLYRQNKRSMEFLDLWRQYHQKYLDVTSQQDQASLRIALYKSRAWIHTLPTEYNVRSRRAQLKMERRATQESGTGFLQPRIYHWHGLDEQLPLFKIFSKFRPMRY